MLSIFYVTFIDVNSTLQLSDMILGNKTFGNVEYWICYYIVFFGSFFISSPFHLHQAEQRKQII